MPVPLAPARPAILPEKLRKPPQELDRPAPRKRAPPVPAQSHSLRPYRRAWAAGSRPSPLLETPSFLDIFLFYGRHVFPGQGFFESLDAPNGDVPESVRLLKQNGLPFD